MCYMHAFAVVLLGLLLSACGGGGEGTSGSSDIAATRAALEATGGRVATTNVVAVSLVPTTDVRVKSLLKVSETRVSRTVFDYVFRVELVNGGAALTNVKGTVTAAGDGTTIVDGSVTVGDMEAGQTSTTLDAITLRHDRTKPFLSTALVWGFTSETGGGSTVPGILLPGAPTDLASAHLDPYAAPRTPADLQTTAVPEDATYYRTQIYAVIKKGATVGQVNGALNAVSGRIVYIAKNSPVVTIQVPDPGSIAVLEGIANTLVNSGAFSLSSLVAVTSVDAIPGDPQHITREGLLTSGGPVFHHLAARFGSLWNLRNIEVDPKAVHVIVADEFGNGPVGELEGAADGIKSDLKCNNIDCTHGYHVLGIITGSFGGANTDTGRVTGALPFALPVHVIDLAARQQSGLLLEEFIADGVATIVTKAPTAKFVLNLSLNTCDVAKVDGCQSLKRVTAAAAVWRARVRNIWPNLPVTAPFAYEKQLVQVTSAGNNHPSAIRNSSWNAAVILGLLGDEAQLVNGLVVENRTAKLDANGIPVIGEVSLRSARGGNISAVGTNVLSFTGPNSTGKYDGTSMATPQVTGLAAAMLAVRPSTPAQDIVTKVIKTRFIDDPSTAPAIDAYAAMLSLDNDMTDAPVRQALLRASVTSPGPASKQLMTYSDVELFLKAYFPAGYPPTSPAIVQPAFSRYDLNGDGYDGEVGRSAPFDMQFDGALQPFAPTRIEFYSTSGSPKIKLDEPAATDFQLLCYYINSPLFNATDKQAVDAELARLTNALFRKISCNDRTVVLEVKDFSFGWSGLPATITLKNFVTPFPATFAGNSSTCTNQGAVAGERGFPLFSTSVPSPVLLTAAIEVSGVPQPTTSGAINRRNCSSFFAESASQVWINATGRAVFGFGGAFISDWEYQVRYTNGLNGVGQKCSVGIVANANFFAPSFESRVCTHEVTATVAE